MLIRLYFICFSFLIMATSVVNGQKIQFSTEEKAWIADHPIIAFGYEPNWEPYEIYENGEYSGIVGDYIHEIEIATGIDMVPIKDITWSESLAGLKDGSIHVVPSCAITSSRREFLRFTAPYIKDPLVIATNEDSHFVGSLTALKNKTVALPISYYTSEIISQHYPAITILKLNSIQECLEQLRDGKVDAFVGSLGVVSYYINKKGFNTIKVAAPTEYEGTIVALAVTKDWEIFRDIAQKVFDTIDSKRMSTIRKEWISVRYEHGFPWKKAFFWIGVVGVASFIIFLLFYYWNRSLKKQIKQRTENEALLKESLKKIQKQDLEKKALLQEIHHRVKNNLQIITSLIRLQANSNENENAVSSLNESIDRIRAVALIHEKTYNSRNLGQISTKEYIESLAVDIIGNLSRQNDIKLEITTEEKSIDSNTIVPLALILNELITNSLKFGIKDQDNGTISIDLSDVEEGLKMTYFDNGNWIENPKSKNFGTSIVEIFTEQLDGSFTLNKTPDGTEYRFLFSN